ncbi:hypothetical protein [Rhodococcus sp. NPDC127528]|uniref:hypothetical protein n=1 Tax=unclassified Rhodococcus (in: high G+C Gram-positive bacteria) TaxID=192944 RepID=UPI00362C4EAB
MRVTEETVRSRRVLCIGDPAAFVEAAQWLARRGLEATPVLDGDLRGGGLLGALATEDVLDGLCTAAEAAAVQRVRALDLPLVWVRDVGRFDLLVAGGWLDNAQGSLQFSGQVMSASR